MAAWKAKHGDRHPSFTLVQETHVSSPEEASQLERQWNRVHGVVAEADDPTSFWSVGDARARGGGHFA